jgi:hypothetical protein
MAEAADPIIRGIYWNRGPLSTHKDGDAESIAWLRSLGISRVHFWLNDQPDLSKLKCDELMAVPKNGTKEQWGADTTRLFLKALQDAGFKVVVTFSPSVSTEDYVNSLFGPDGPVALVKGLDGAELELDLEGNWTDRYHPANCSKKIPIVQAKQLFIDRLRNEAPTVVLGVSTRPDLIDIKKADYNHRDILKFADWISPQLYYPNQIVQHFNAFREFGKPVWPALDVESFQGAIFDKLLESTDQFRGCYPSLVNGYVLWSRAAIGTEAPARPYFQSHLPTQERKACLQPN